MVAAFLDIMIPQRCIKRDPVSQQGRKRLFESLFEVTAAAIGVNVIARGEYKINAARL